MPLCDSSSGPFSWWMLCQSVTLFHMDKWWHIFKTTDHNNGSYQSPHRFINYGHQGWNIGGKIIFELGFRKITFSGLFFPLQKFNPEETFCFTEFGGMITVSRREFFLLISNLTRSIFVVEYHHRIIHKNHHSINEEIIHVIVKPSNQLTHPEE